MFALNRAAPPPGPRLIGARAVAAARTRPRTQAPDSPADSDPTRASDPGSNPRPCQGGPQAQTPTPGLVSNPGDPPGPAPPRPARLQTELPARRGPGASGLVPDSALPRVPALGLPGGGAPRPPCLQSRCGPRPCAPPGPDWPAETGPRLPPRGRVLLVCARSPCTSAATWVPVAWSGVGGGRSDTAPRVPGLVVRLCRPRKDLRQPGCRGDVC